MHFFYFTKIGPNKSRCREQEEFKNVYINGVVTNKFLSDNHNYETITIENPDNTTINYDLSFEMSGIYSEINIGDTIFKLNNELITKFGTTIKYANFGCQ